MLDARAPNAILFREFFDVVRFGDRPSYASEFRRWLFEKYRDQPVNVLVATQQLTLDLLAPDDGNPWRGVPLVYGTFGDPAADLGATYPTASGIEAEHPFPQSLGLITSILPGTRRIAVVGGASRAERTRNARYASDVRRAGLDFLDLGDLTLDALVERVGTLAADTVPILVGFQVDAAGRTFQSEEALARIVRATSRPLFTLNSADLGNGWSAASSLAAGWSAGSLPRRRWRDWTDNRLREPPSPLPSTHVPCSTRENWPGGASPRAACRPAARSCSVQEASGAITGGR